MVRNAVLAAQFQRDLIEDLLKIAGSAHKEYVAAGFLRQLSQGFWTAAVRVGDGVDDRVTLVSRNQCAAHVHLAGRIFAVGNEDHGLPADFLGQLLLCCQVYGVKQRCSAASQLQGFDGGSQLSCTVGEILHQRDPSVEGDNQREVFWSENGLDKGGCRPSLFEKNRLNAWTRVDQYGKRQR